MTQQVSRAEGGWIVEQDPIGNAHVIPAEQQGTEAEHQVSGGCWCQPRPDAHAEVRSPDLMDHVVYLHRRTHDYGHLYSDDER